jgi:hypothetical protein
MIECRACGEMFYTDPERIGARCRRCREPLYERREAARDAKELAPAGQCAAHPRNAAVAACNRCGAFVCAVCRTRWYDKPLCPACAVQAMGEKEVRPEQALAHQRQARRAVGGGILAWSMTLAAGLLILRGGPALFVWAGLLGVGAFLPSLFGVGQAVAAIRSRGKQLTLATVGLGLSAGHVGIVFGLTLLALWKS